MKSWLLIIAIAACLSSCQSGPQAIEYGTDMCAFCKMTVVDPQHAAEIVTDKGRVYTFDAIECMANYVHQEEELIPAHLLVNDYEKPGVLLEAATCHYLISEQIPSPMGANLSAFSSVENASAMQKAKGGQLYTWQALLEYLK